MKNFKINPGDKVLITTDSWFYAPDGRSYRAVYGTVIGVFSDSETLGINTNQNSSNWFVVVGNTTIAGCQIHYAVKTNCCDIGSVFDFSIESGETKEYLRPSYIYDADGSNRKCTYENE